MLIIGISSICNQITKKLGGLRALVLVNWLARESEGLGSNPASTDSFFKGTCQFSASLLSKSRPKDPMSHS